MYTDDNGIVRFESLDTIAPLQVGLNAALESVSDALDSSTRIWPVANVSERDALGVGTPEKPLFVYRTDTGNLERNTGDGWEIYPEPGSETSFQAMGGMSGTVRVWKQQRLVTLEGGMLGSIPSPGTVIGVVPDGFRPLSRSAFLVGGSTSSGGRARMLTIERNGEIILSWSGALSNESGGTGIFITGITYYSS